MYRSNLSRNADKSLARPTSRCILFDGENISFDASLVIYVNSTNIPPIMIIKRIYEIDICGTVHHHSINKNNQRDAVCSLCLYYVLW